MFKNDLDYPTAKALATEVIENEAFEPISEGLLEEARFRLNECTSIICCKKTFGSMEKANEELLAYAKTLKKPIEFIETDQ